MDGYDPIAGGHGFCLVNSTAVGAAHAVAVHGKRVAIVDIDVHHGNGTENIVLERLVHMVRGSAAAAGADGAGADGAEADGARVDGAASAGGAARVQGGAPARGLADAEESVAEGGTEAGRRVDRSEARKDAPAGSAQVAPAEKVPRRGAAGSAGSSGATDACVGAAAAPGTRGGLVVDVDSAVVVRRSGGRGSGGGGGGDGGGGGGGGGGAGDGDGGWPQDSPVLFCSTHLYEHFPENPDYDFFPGRGGPPAPALADKAADGVPGIGAAAVGEPTADEPTVDEASTVDGAGADGAGAASVGGAGASTCPHVLNLPLEPLWRVRSCRSGAGAKNAPPRGRAAFRLAVSEKLLPALRTFAPDLLLISAGFDGADGDDGNAQDDVSAAPPAVCSL